MTLLARLARSIPSEATMVRPPTLPTDRPGFSVHTREYGVRPDATRQSLLGGAFDRMVLPTSDQIVRDVPVLLGPPSNVRSLAVFDCETTGLGAGTGALPFVLGLAWYQGPKCLRIEQWALRSVAAERAMLVAFVEAWNALPESTCLVTFNGASFDLPLVRGRLRRYGLATPPWSQTHLDLVHVARRLFRTTLPDRRLVTLERNQLGVTRRGDVPGSEIPARFWQAEGRVLGSGPDPLTDVLDHNAGDLLSLPALLTRLADLVRRPTDPDMELAVANLLCATGRADEALSRLDRVLKPWMDGRNARPAGNASRGVALLAATLWRRQSRFDRAEMLLRWVCHEFPGDPEAHERLAKHLEHRLLSPEEALAVVSGSRCPCPRRLARLHRKAARARKATLEPSLFQGRPCLDP